MDGDGDMGVVRRIRPQSRPTRRLPAAEKATTSWPAPTEVSRRRGSIGARIAAVVAALAIVAAGVVIATNSGGSGSPTKAVGAKPPAAPATSVPTSSDPAEQARELADFFRAQGR